VKRWFITEYPSPKVIFISFDVWQNVFGKFETAGLITRFQKPAQSASCRQGGAGGYEQLSKQSFVVYLTAKKRVLLMFMGVDKTLPACDQHLLSPSPSFFPPTHALYAFATCWEPLLHLPYFLFWAPVSSVWVTYNLGFDFGKRGKVYVGLTSCGGGRAEILPQGLA
jgi:hypothetical protein